MVQKHSRRGREGTGWSRDDCNIIKITPVEGEGEGATLNNTLY